MMGTTLSGWSRLHSAYARKEDRELSRGCRGLPFYFRKTKAGSQTGAGADESPRPAIRLRRGGKCVWVFRSTAKLCGNYYLPRSSIDMRYCVSNVWQKQVFVWGENKRTVHRQDQGPATQNFFLYFSRFVIRLHRPSQPGCPDDGDVTFFLSFKSKAFFSFLLIF